MPRMGAAAREERRQEWMEAAWRCVARGGYRNLSVDDVCAEAGLSKGSFYTHFTSKQDLLFALLDADAAGQEEVIDELGEARQPSIERIRRFLRILTERGEDPARVNLRADLWAEVANDEALREQFVIRVRERRAVIAAWVSEAIASGELVEIPANALASILLALADGLMLHNAVDPGGFRWANIRSAVGTLLDGLRA